MGQRIYRYVQRELLAVVGTNAFALITAVVCAEGATQPVFTKNTHQATFVKQAFELNITSLIKAAHTINFIKGPVDEVLVRNWLYHLVREQSAELSPPCFWKIRIRATP